MKRLQLHVLPPSEVGIRWVLYDSVRLVCSYCSGKAPKHFSNHLKWKGMTLKSPEAVTSSHLPICICSPIFSQMAESPQSTYPCLPGDMILFFMRFKTNKKLILILNRLLWFHFNISTAAWDHFWAEKEFLGEDIILPGFLLIPPLWTIGHQGSCPVWIAILIALWA